MLATRWPFSVTTLPFPVAVIRLRMIAIGMTQINRTSVVNRSSFSG